MLKALIERSPHGEELLQYFNEAERTALEPIQKEERGAWSFLRPFEWIELIHFSWYLYVLEEVPFDIQNLFLSLLSKNKIKSMQKYVPQISPTPIPSLFMRIFVANYLKKKMQPSGIKEIDFLPRYALNVLLKLSKFELEQLANFLGVYDLAADLKQIVDTSLLKKVYDVLDRTQMKLLQYFSRQPIRVGLPKMGLQSWDGTQKQLGSLLHQRGLHRIGMAISDADPSFKWHLLHHLDIGRARIIQKVTDQKYDPSQISYFQSQLLHLLKWYKR